MRRLCRQELLGLLRRKRHRRILHSAKWRSLPPPGWSGRPGCRPPSPSRNPARFRATDRFTHAKAARFSSATKAHAAARPSVWPRNIESPRATPRRRRSAAKTRAWQPLPPKDLRARLSPLLFCGPLALRQVEGTAAKPDPSGTSETSPANAWPQARFPALRRSQRPRRLTWQGGRNFPPRPRRNPRDQRLRLSPPVV